MRKIFIFGVATLCTFNAFADDVDLINTEIQEKEALVQKLKNEILQIDSEIMRCERVRKNWKTATIVGGVGTVATGTAAVIQAVKLNKQKSQVDDKK